MSMASILLRKREQLKQREAEGLDLLAHRKALGLTQVQLGEKLGYHWNMIARMERGEVPIQKRTWLAVRQLRATRGGQPAPVASVIARMQIPTTTPTPTGDQQ